MRIAGRCLLGLVSALALIVAVGALAAVPALAAERCPNETLREEDNSRGLPDCRAYEMVSPPEKNNYDVGIAATGEQAEATPVTPNGDRLSFFSLGSFAGNQAGVEFNQYLSTRGSSGWHTEGISPPKQENFSSLDTHSGYLAFTEDLSTAIVQNWTSPGWGLFRREADGALQTIAKPLENASAFAELHFDPVNMASKDLSRIVFESQEALTENALEGGWNAYEWANGRLSLISVLPDGTPTYLPDDESVSISPDGSRVFWSPEAGGTEGYVTEEDGTTTTIPGHGWPTANGSKVFFVGGGDLIEYNLETRQETDLTPDTSDPNGAQVQSVLGASEDRSYLYFAAEGDLARGATAGEENLYVWHNGTIAFIATVTRRELVRLSGDETGKTLLQVSPDGSALLFASATSLTGYENAGNEEIFLYDTSSGSLRCVSCNPSGQPATGSAQLGKTAGPVAGQYMPYENVTTEGTRVFFETPEALLPTQDTDGAEDVYEWEAQGSGSCQTSTDPDGGCLYLISSGRDSAGSYFENATPSGNDVFFITRAQLVGQDTDSNVDLYDARVNGGFPAPNTPPPCTYAESCRGAQPLAASFAAPGSEMLSGAGNLAPAVQTTGQQAKPKPKLTRRQKLTRALRQCAKKPKVKRKACRARAHKQFGAQAPKRKRGKASANRTGSSANKAGTSKGRSGR